MKKLVAIIAIAAICAFTLTSCSDEEVKPNDRLSGSVDPVKR